MESFFRENGIFVASTIFMIGLIVSANVLSQKGNLDYTYQPHTSEAAQPARGQSTVVATTPKQTSIATTTAAPKSVATPTTVKQGVRRRLYSEGHGDDN